VVAGLALLIVAALVVAIVVGVAYLVRIVMGKMRPPR
jgi:hypothetical protein